MSIFIHQTAHLPIWMAWFEILPAKSRRFLLMQGAGWVQNKREVSASQCHNTVIHCSWKAFDMVNNMLSVHPETCQSNEQPVRAAKSQEVKSQQKMTTLMCNTPELSAPQTKSVTENMRMMEYSRGDPEGLQMFILIHDLKNCYKWESTYVFGDLSYQSQHPNHYKERSSRFSLVSQSQISML